MADGADDTRLSPPQRLRLAVVCVLLATLALKQAPDRVVGDTKLGIALDAWRFLRGALRLWDPSTDFGVTQNQGYGYLFPMGPFFGIGTSLGVDAWVLQRLWWAVLLCLAFTGAEAVARRLGIGTPGTRLVAALAFALSPRMLTTLGPISVESLPYCLAPWVLVPLIDGSRRGSPRRAAARSAVAVLCMGAVNAAAVLAALPPAALWLLTREPGPRRRRLMAWWAGCVLLATSWWLLPLLLLGSYSPPFLDHIESAATTTSVTSLVEVLRGTSDWVAYVVTGAGGPTWPTGFELVTEQMPILFSVVVLVAGLAGLLRRDLPERLWLVGTALLGVAALTFGHVGELSPPWAGFERDLLDGALAPFRNVHKFDVVLRLPLALACAHVLAVLLDRPQPTPRQVRLQRSAVTLGAAAAVVGMALPAVSPGLQPRAPFAELPPYWEQAAAWLADHQPGRALVVPGASTVDYYWGSPNDEPLQVLARSPWAVRGAVPLTPSNTIRALDAVEAALAVGQGSGLAPALERAGVRYLVVRNDLDYGVTGSTRPLLVHEALAQSPGIARVASFGGEIGGGVLGRYADQGLEVPYSAVEVFEVAAAGPPARLAASADTVRVVGGPEALPGLLSSGVVGDEPVRLDGDAGRVVLTDTLRRREVFFGRQQANRSPTLTRDEPFRLDSAANDYLAPGAALTTARYVGASSVTASSSASDAAAFGGAVADRLPYAAVDGDPATAWSADPGRPAGEASWRLVFASARPLDDLTLTGARAPDTVEVVTDEERVRVQLQPGIAVPVPLTEPTQALTVRGAVALAEVSARDLVVERTLDLPQTERADLVSLATTPVRPSCFALLRSWLCGRGVATGSEDLGDLDRTVHLGSADRYDLSRLVARPVPGAALDALLQGGTRVTSSSSAVPDPRGNALAAVDGRTGTGWRAAPGDQDPRLTLAWALPQRLSSIRVVVDPGLGASRPRSATLVSGDQTREVTFDDAGRATFAPLTTASVVVHLTDPVLTGSVDPYTDETSLSPVGVSEVRLSGAPAPAPGSRVVTLPCGQGPTVTVGSAVVQTSARATAAQLADLAPVRLTPCTTDPVDLGGATRVVSRSTAVLAPTQVQLTRTSSTRAPAAATTPEVEEWGAVHRVLALDARDSEQVLQVHENVNAGWHASLNGRELRAVTLDGWQQGWVVPAGESGKVELRYAPDRTYRLGLVLGAVLALVLLGLALRPGSSHLAAVPGVQPGRWGAALLAVPVLLVGGWVAAVLGASFALVRRLAPAGVAATGLAGVLLVLAPWGTPDYAGRDALPQALCVAGLCAVWAGLLPPLRRSLSLRRRAGRSSST